ncbi:MAG: hypothetical protein EBY41_03455, partial [Proteobacteria bacterium]|nr:hypothetical protein [Pseudomonadota bacterium]
MLNYSLMSLPVLNIDLKLNLKRINALVKDDLNDFDRLISQRLGSDIRLVNEISQHIIDAKGKRIRPLVSLLASRAVSESPSNHVLAALIIELIHTATLLHDDVVDQSLLRRGKPTANAKFGPKPRLAETIVASAYHFPEVGKGIVDVDYAQEPDSIYWAVRTDGTLLGMTYQREEDIIAWHRHILGGSYKLTFNGASAVTESTSDPNKNGFVTISNHGLSTGDKVTFSAGGGTKIAGLVDGNDYFVFVIDANKFEFASSYDQAIDRTVLQIGDGVGANHTLSAKAQVKSVSTISE